MEQHKQKSSMILKYSKRRYDGGPEVDLIRNIERKQIAHQLNKLNDATQAAENAPLRLPENVPTIEPEVAVAAQPAPSTRKTKTLHALVLGPVKICVGLVGMMTAALAIFTFQRLNNQPLLAQGKALFADCFQTFKQGLLDTATTPVRVLKAALAKA